VYLFSPGQSYISYITIIPLFLVDTNLIESSNYISFVRVLRIFSMNRMDKMFQKKNQAFVRVYFKLAFTLLGTIIFFAAVILELENTNIENCHKSISEMYPKCYCLDAVPK